MLALVITARGEAPAVADAPDRDPGPGEVRVAVEAASVNGFDLAVAAGYVWDSMPHTFPVVMGRDFAGRVDTVGEDVEGWAVGDAVAGVNTALELGAGPIADHFTVPAASLTRVPDGVTAVQAAAVGLAGVTAADAVEALDPDPGDTVLISGATGGVGAFAVQLAVARGSAVIATSRPGEATDFVLGLGAQDAVDYTSDLAAAVREVSPDGVTKVLHAAGDPRELGALILPTGGRLASVLGATPDQVGRDEVEVVAVMGAYLPVKLAALLDGVAAGQLTVPVAATYPLVRATEALSDFAGGKLGKLVVTP
jgi:NADPH:quinone reductase-like Zn-dependent oxidoreductase